jgi:hypothetical protein
MRIDAFLKTFHVQSVFDYVLQEAYLTSPVSSVFSRRAPNACAKDRRGSGMIDAFLTGRRAQAGIAKN